MESQDKHNRNTKRADSSGPAPGVGANSLSQGGPPAGGLHSSGGSTGPHSLTTVSGPNLARSRTHGRIGVSSHNKSNILSMIKCPCFIEPPAQLQNNLNRAHRGRKQPILHNSENTANCGHCGQFYAVKVSKPFSTSIFPHFCHLDSNQLQFSTGYTIHTYFSIWKEADCVTGQNHQNCEGARRCLQARRADLRAVQQNEGSIEESPRDFGSTSTLLDGKS